MVTADKSASQCLFSSTSTMNHKEGFSYRIFAFGGGGGGDMSVLQQNHVGGSGGMLLQETFEF